MDIMNTEISLRINRAPEAMEDLPGPTQLRDGYAICVGGGGRRGQWDLMLTDLSLSGWKTLHNTFM